MFAYSISVVMPFDAWHPHPLLLVQIVLLLHAALTVVAISMRRRGLFPLLI